MPLAKLPFSLGAPRMTRPHQAPPRIPARLAPDLIILIALTVCFFLRKIPTALLRVWRAPNPWEVVDVILRKAPSMYVALFPFAPRDYADHDFHTPPLSSSICFCPLINPHSVMWTGSACVRAISSVSSGALTSASQVEFRFFDCLSLAARRSVHVPCPLRTYPGFLSQTFGLRLTG